MPPKGIIKFESLWLPKEKKSPWWKIIISLMLRKIIYLFHKYSKLLVFAFIKEQGINIVLDYSSNYINIFKKYFVSVHTTCGKNHKIFLKNNRQYLELAKYMSKYKAYFIYIY